MKWNHLPVAGGLYDQDPELLDAFEYMFSKRAEVEEERRKREEREAKNTRGRPPKRR